MSKPPAFQFYARDWMTSPSVRLMYAAQRGLYIDMLALAWDSDEPGTLPANLKVLARILGCEKRILRDFLTKFPEIFRTFPGDSPALPQESSDIIPPFDETNPGRIYNRKLREQWVNLQQFHEKARDRGKMGAEARWHSDASSINQAMENDGSSSSPASSSASKNNTNTAGGGGIKTELEKAEAALEAQRRRTGKGVVAGRPNTSPNSAPPPSAKRVKGPYLKQVFDNPELVPGINPDEVRRCVFYHGVVNEDSWWRDRRVKPIENLIEKWDEFADQVPVDFEIPALKMEPTPAKPDCPACKGTGEITTPTKSRTGYEAERVDDCTCITFVEVPPKWR